MRNIKGIVFDLDDTLFPQVSFKKSGFNAVAKWLNRKSNFSEVVIYDELCDIMEKKGPSYPRIFDDLVVKLRLNPNLLPRIIQVFRYHDPVISCYPGVFQTLERLRQNYRTGILTDGMLVVQEKKIHALGLNRKVDAVLCSDTMGIVKPAWQLFAWFEEQFELSGQELLYAGDNPKKDFIGARARGWKTIRILTGEFAEAEFSAEFEADSSTMYVSDVPVLLEKKLINVS